MSKIYRNFNQEELDNQYRASATVPNIQLFIDQYISLSSDAQMNLDCILDLKYGPGDEETLDLFPVPKQKSSPLFIFIHGGYWRMLSKNESSFMAPNLVRKNVAVAAINYTLAPYAKIDQIVSECRRSIKWLYDNATNYGIDREQIYVGGSSAGGHLTGMMVSRNWQNSYGIPSDVIKGGLPISGLFDLEPIAKSFVNEWMGMSDIDAKRNSPDQNITDQGCPLIVAVGENETSEFKRQSSDFTKLWNNNGRIANFLECKNNNHFDAPLELCKADSIMTKSLISMIVK
ncbi:MAG: esterase [Rhodospirillaceae bacterium]|nr:esterase [Rhodospirillaceae bacterium]OUT79000.1 MAG: hypothetical protein CBB83_04945 [Rhodospirillaceae bacterium TMED23]|tara:strand:+ start:15317 stop:16180 length:864 start_codon:yes stop_codon:yes gene_type:complete